jgi:hypothetical protein
VFDGALAADRRSIAGTFVLHGAPLLLTFTQRTPGAAAPAPSRPQTPKKPYPYRAEDVVFHDAGAHVRLAGTLTLPRGHGPFPAVVLVAGSGPDDRNESIFGHQPFLILADYLTRHGLAVLRYDKRGVGASTGDYAKATTLDFADDAEAAAVWLRSRPEIDARRIGLVGHSEGGLIAPIVATHDPNVAFIVLMAGPGVDGVDLQLEQARLSTKAYGMSDAAAADYVEALRLIFGVVRANKDPAVAAAKLKTAIEPLAQPHSRQASILEGQASIANSPWSRFFFDYDPAPTLAEVRCPVLALIGSKDLQVPPDQNLPPIRVALAHNLDAEVEELPDLNHFFQPAKTGSPDEYIKIEETIAPLALETITGWIVKHDGAAK